MSYIRLCPPPPTIWQIRQEMIDLHKQYNLAMEYTANLQRKYYKKRREYEELEIARVIQTGEVKVKKTSSAPKEVKLTMAQVKAIAEKLGVSIDF